MWKIELRHLLSKAFDRALLLGSSTGISLIWLGFFFIIFSFAFTIGVVWLAQGRNIKALRAALTSWTSVIGALSAFLFLWGALYSYSLIKTIYLDHNYLARENSRLTTENLHLTGKDKGVTPLILSATQSAAITAAMRPYAGVTMTVVFFNDEDEDFADKFVQSLRAAGIKVTGNGPLLRSSPHERGFFVFRYEALWALPFDSLQRVLFQQGLIPTRHLPGTDAGVPSIFEIKVASH